MNNQNNKNILILKSDKDDFERFYINQMQSDNISTQAIYKFRSGIGWLIQILWIELLHLPLQHVWYASWKKELTLYDIVIIFDRNLSWSIIPYIKKKNKKKVIAWYWNPVKKFIPNKYLKYCEAWSFDEYDCKKYGMKKNIQFHVGSVVQQGKEIVYNALFIGKDKGRYKTVMKIKQFLEDSNLTVFINIVKDKSSVINDDGVIRDYKEPISYYQVSEKIQECECIIDVPQSGQSGMTLRVLEALQYNRKLITTDKTIKKYDWYDPKRVLIFDSETSKEEIIDFFKGTFQTNDEYGRLYSFENWIDNFIRY